LKSVQLLIRKKGGKKRRGKKKHLFKRHRPLERRKGPE